MGEPSRSADVDEPARSIALSRQTLVTDTAFATHALRSVLTIGLVLGAEPLLVHFTHALQIDTHGVALSAAAAARVGVSQPRGFRVVAMVLGAIVGLISSLGVMDRTAEVSSRRCCRCRFPMVGALALGIAIGGHRTVALVVLVMILTAGTYCRRFGPRGFTAGILLFVGNLIGFFLHAAVTLSDLGWLSAEIGVGLLVAIVVRFALFYPRPAKALARTRRSYAARARTIAALALEVFDDPKHNKRQVHQLQRRLVRLNEAAPELIDAQLGDRGALPHASSSGELLHQRLFDVELALTNMARFAQALGRLGVPSDERDHIRGALVGIIAGDNERAKSHAHALLAQLRDGVAVGAADPGSAVVIHRFAGTVIDLADAIAAWTALGRSSSGAEATFQPSVTLLGGWLPGSSQVSAAASLEPGRRFGDRASLAPYTRAAIQIGVAVGGAIALGDLLSERRFYWAVISAFIVFMGTHSSGEQARKAAHRVIGTVVGIGVGSLIVRLIGHHSGWAIAAILASLFIGFYLIRISYAFMAIAITVMVSQLYVQLDEFSSSLLLLRLEETAIGAAAAIAVATVVLPLRTRRVLRIAIRDNVAALSALVNDATKPSCAASRFPRQWQQAYVCGDAPVTLDASFQALLATAQPLRRSLFGTVDENIQPR